MPQIIHITIGTTNCGILESPLHTNLHSTRYNKKQLQNEKILLKIYKICSLCSNFFFNFTIKILRLKSEVVGAFNSVSARVHFDHNSETFFDTTILGQYYCHVSCIFFYFFFLVSKWKYAACQPVPPSSQVDTCSGFLCLLFFLFTFCG